MLSMKSILSLVFLTGLVSSKIINTENQKQSPKQSNIPKILWIDCPEDVFCDKCLDVTFVSGNDVACLNQKYPDTECILEGNFLTGGARVFVSSEQCLDDGNMDNVQVNVTFFMQMLTFILIYNYKFYIVL